MSSFLWETPVPSFLSNLRLVTKPPWLWSCGEFNVLPEEVVEALRRLLPGALGDFASKSLEKHRVRLVSVASGSVSPGC